MDRSYCPRVSLHSLRLSSIARVIVKAKLTLLCDDSRALSSGHPASGLFKRRFPLPSVSSHVRTYAQQRTRYVELAMLRTTECLSIERTRLNLLGVRFANWARSHCVAL